MFLNVDIQNLAISENFSLENISFTADQGDIISLIGPSGSGKSSLLKAILGVYSFNGELAIDGRTVNDLPIEKRNIGIIFQDFALFPHLNTMDNIFVANKDKKRLDEVSTMLEISHLLKHYPHQLSGGEKQRVAIARSLMVRPELILFDEPFSSLDNHLKDKLRKDLKALLKKIKMTAIFVVHDLDDAFYLSDYIAVMKDGELVEFNICEKIISSRDKQTCEFLDVGTVLPKKVSEYIGLGKEKKQYVRYHEIILENSTDGQFELIEKIDLGKYFFYQLKFQDDYFELYSSRVISTKKLELKLIEI